MRCTTGHREERQGRVSSAPDPPPRWGGCCPGPPPHLVLKDLDFFLHLREGLVAGLDQVDILVALVFHDVIQGGELLEAVVRVVATLRQVRDHEALHLYLSVTHVGGGVVVVIGALVATAGGLVPNESSIHHVVGIMSYRRKECSPLKGAIDLGTTPRFN